MWQNSKNQIVTKVKNSNCAKTPIVTKLKKLKLWQNSKTQIVTKLKGSNCDKTQKQKLWQILKTRCDKTQKLKLWQNSKTQILTKLKTQMVTKLSNDISDSCDNSDKKFSYIFLKLFFLSLELWQNSKTKIMTKLKKSNV